MLLKVKGLVIRESAVGESDKYLTLLTEEHGKIFLRARGVRNLKSKYMPATQILSYSEFEILQTQSFTKMNEASHIEVFFNIRMNVEKFALAMYFADIVSECATETPENDGLLQLMLRTLHNLSEKERPLPLLKGVFEMRLMALAGFMPDLGCCSACGADIESGCRFDLTGGGLICPECDEEHMKRIPFAERNSARLDSAVLRALRHCLTSPDERMFSFSLTGAEEEFASVCERYVLAQMEHGYKTLDFYKNLAIKND